MSNRFQLKQFAGNATNNGQFGSYQAGTKLITNDFATIQNLTAWLNGWLDATNQATQLPKLNEMQALQYVLCGAIKELYSEGIPEWLSTETYYLNSVVRVDNKLYINITGTYTTTSPVIDTTNWSGFLTNSANTDLSNLSTTGQAIIDGKANTDLSNILSNIDYVVETGSNANGNYRKYKSGLIEQFCYVDIPAVGGTQSVMANINFPTPFTTDTYDNVSCQIQNGVSYYSYLGFAFSGKTTTTETLNIFNNANNYTAVNAVIIYVRGK